MVVKQSGGYLGAIDQASHEYEQCPLFFVHSKQRTWLDVGASKLLANFPGLILGSSYPSLPNELPMALPDQDRPPRAGKQAAS